LPLKKKKRKKEGRKERRKKRHISVTKFIYRNHNFPTFHHQLENAKEIELETEIEIF
jgi:hypothetical protein